MTGEIPMPGLRTEYSGGPIEMSAEDVEVERTEDGVSLHYGIAFTDENGETDVGTVSIRFNEAEERIEVSVP